MVTVPGGMYDAHEAITVSSTAVTPTAATVAQRNKALITVEDAAVRFRFDGTAPTSTTGHELEDGDVLILDSANQIGNVQFIRRDGTDATLRASYGV
jgi:hypothetical protein